MPLRRIVAPELALLAVGVAAVLVAKISADANQVLAEPG